jgi:hypothetical protein
MVLPIVVWVAQTIEPLGTSEGTLAAVPPGSTLPGLRRRNPSGILSATVWRPWRVGQFQLSFLPCPRWIPDPPAMAAGLPRSASGTDRRRGWKGGVRRAAALAD